MAKTSIHITPAKVSSSEGHNLRLKHLDYVRPEFSKENESWCEVEDLPNHLTNLRIGKGENGTQNAEVLRTH